MDREAAVKLMRALVDAGFIVDDQRADAAVEKVALEAGLNREQLKAALKYAREQKWIGDSDKAAWCASLKPGLTRQMRDSCKRCGRPCQGNVVAWPRQTGLASLQGTLQLSIAFQGVTVLCAVACEADKKQSEANQPDYDHGGNRNWPAFRYAI